MLATYVVRDVMLQWFICTSHGMCCCTTNILRI